MMSAQNVLTPQEQLEKAQKELEAAKKAVEEAKANAAAAKAKADAEAAAKAKATQEEAARLKAEAERLRKEAEKMNAEAEKIKSETNKKADNTEVKPVVVKEPTLDKSNGWVIPTNEKKKVEKTTKATTATGVQLKKDPKYLEGAITTDANGKVEFVLETTANGKSAQEIYDIVYNYMNELTQGSQNIQSRVALVNKDEHIIANAMDEWLVFSSSFISLDRSEFKYQLVAKIADNSLQLTMTRLYYIYEEGRNTGFKESAENVISDKVALTKKKNDLAKIYGKFRRATIDRKDQIFKEISMLVKQ